MSDVFCLTNTWVEDTEIPLHKGNCLVVYSDEGPLGPCGQSMDTTCPHTYIHWFPDEAAMRRHLSKIDSIGRKGVRARIQYVVIGDGGSGQMQFHRHKD